MLDHTTGDATCPENKVPSPEKDQLYIFLAKLLSYVAEFPPNLLDNIIFSGFSLPSHFSVGCCLGRQFPILKIACTYESVVAVVPGLPY